MIATPKHLQDDQCLATEAKVKFDGVAKHDSGPNPYWASVWKTPMEGGG